MFPEGENEGPLPHRRRDAVVLPRDRTATTPHRRSRDCSTSCCPCSQEIVGAPSPARVRHRRRSGDGLLTQGADGYQLTWMDAKVDDWVVTPRRGKAGRDQRALVQRADAAGRVARRAGSMAAPRRLAARRPARCRTVVQRALLESSDAAGCTTSSTARAAATTRVPPEPGASRSSLPHPPLDRQHWEAGARERRERAARRRSGCARSSPRPPRLQAASTSATCARATRRITRAPCGRG